MTLKAGIIGCGSMGQQYAGLIQSDPNCELVAICDTDGPKLKSLASQYRVKAFLDYRQLLEQDLDFVYIGTPDFAHADIAVATARAGINMLIEKPLATNTAEARRIVDAVRVSKVKAKVCYTNRWNPPFVAAKRVVDNGEIGDVISVYCRLSDSIFVPTKMIKWADRTSPGWFLMSHTLDMARWFIGAEVDNVYAVGHKKVLREKYAIDTYDSLFAMVQFRNGAVAILESNWILPETLPLVIDFHVEIIGARGCLHINTHDQMVHLVANQYRHIPTIDTHINKRLKGQVAFSFEDFIDCLVYGREPEPNVEDSLVTTQVLEAIHRSAELGGEKITIHYHDDH